MKILITEISDSQLKGVVVTGAPVVGREYFLEDARDGTLAQNRMFHLLLRIYLDSNLYPWEIQKDLDSLRDKVLLACGKGFEWVIYVNEKGTLSKAMKPKDLPEHLQKDRERVFGRLHKWSAYGLKDRRLTISALINHMEAHGVQGKVFDEIVAEFRT